MKHYFTSFLIAAVLFSPLTNVEAKTQPELQKTIDQLLLKIKQLESNTSFATVGATSNPNLQITSFDDGKDGKPKIKITGPTSKNKKFNKTDPTNPILISWIASNVPKNTNLTIDLNTVKIKGGVGGGSAQFALPEGDSKGTYKWDIYGEGRASAGNYRVQLGLEECSSLGCHMNAHFPGQEEDVTFYAQSRSVGVSVIGKNAKALPTKVASIATIDDKDTANPTVTGTTNIGITEVGFSIDQGDKIYGSGPISVTNNRWSHTITQNLKPGTYTLTLYVNNVVANTKVFKVTQ